MRYSGYPEYTATDKRVTHPKDWPAERLRFSILSNPVKSEVASWKDDTLVSFVPMEAVGEHGGIDLSKQKPIGNVYGGYTYFANGDIVIAKITPCFENGKGAISEDLMNGVAFGTTEFHVVRPLKGISKRWLFYLTMSDTFRNIGTSKMLGAGGQKRVPEDFIKNFRTGIPSYTEQRKIADFLDWKTGQIDGLIAKKKQLIEKLKEKRIALITQAVTKGLNPNVPMRDSGIPWLGEVPEHWDVLSIKRLTPVSRGSSPRPIEDPKYFDDEGEYAWVRISDVTSNEHYLRETTQRLSELGKSFSVPLEPGSLFLSIAGSVGKPMITAIKACIHDGFVYFPQLQINFEYLFYIFESGQPYLGLGKLGTQLNLNTDTVGNIKLALPKKEEQENIVDFLDLRLRHLDTLVTKNQQLIEKLTEYRTALITAATTGKIDVRKVKIAQGMSYEKTH